MGGEFKACIVAMGEQKGASVILEGIKKQIQRE